MRAAPVSGCCPSSTIRRRAIHHNPAAVVGNDGLAPVEFFRRHGGAVACPAYGLVVAALYIAATSAGLKARSQIATSSMPPSKNRPVKTGLSPIVNCEVFIGALGSWSLATGWPSQ